MEELPEELVGVLERALGPTEGPGVPLEGGITNRNLRMSFGGAEYVVRLCGKETAALGIDRLSEVQATRAAHVLGFAPEVVLYLPEHEVVVTRFVAGTPASAADVRAPARQAQIAAALRSFHERGEPLPASFNPFSLGALYRKLTLERDGRVPPSLPEAQRVVRRIESALTHPEHRPVPCHNDLLTANFILGADGRVTIVDWEYAGMGDRYFDLGNLAVNNGLESDDEERLLEAYWGEPPDERRRAALALMRIVSDYREGTWGMVQGVLSEVEFDYAAYADKHLGRLLEAAEDPRLERWLDAASA